jgi:GT2 family glycosyltransferase
MDDGLNPSRPLVSIVVVTWNSAAFIERCLAALRAQTYEPVEVIIIDNASTDDSVAICRRLRFDVHRNEKNRGFSAAVNQAIARSRGEFVLLCNPDAFLDPTYAEVLVNGFQVWDEHIGAATGTLLRDDGSGIDTAGIYMTRSGRHLDIQQHFIEHPQRHVFGVSGAAGMYRMSFLKDVAINGEIFDEDFFVYREDADIAWRGRLFGWQAMHVAAATGRHVRRVTPERRRALPAEINMHSVKNRFLLRLKNEGWLLALINLPYEIGRDLLVIGATLTIETSSLPAFIWLWKNFSRVWAKRKVIQSRRRVTDLKLARWFR